jgi:HD-like signal output (HDOD) protein
MPQSVMRLIEALGDDDADAQDLAEIIESDLGLASKVLSLANSAYYGVNQKVATLKRAIVVIGFDELKLLALGAGLAEIFNMRAVPPEFDGRGLWLHCIGVSWAAKRMAEAVDGPPSGEVMFAGLLHDLGKLVLAVKLPEEFQAVMDRCQRGLPYYQAEEALGLQHADIGYWLAKRWSLPEVHTDVIRYHHHPKPATPHAQACALVQLADHMVKSLNLGLVQESRPSDFPTVLKTSGLGLAEYQKALQDAENALPDKMKSWREAFGRWV